MFKYKYFKTYIHILYPEIHSLLIKIFTFLKWLETKFKRPCIYRMICSINNGTRVIYATGNKMEELNSFQGRKRIDKGLRIVLWIGHAMEGHLLIKKFFCVFLSLFYVYLSICTNDARVCPDPAWWRHDSV